MGTWPVAPTLDPRKFNVDPEVFTSLLREFDERMLPWARGDMSRLGETFPEVVERLDAATMDSNSAENPKKALWQKKNSDKKSKAADPSSRSDAWLQSAGFLTGNDRWGLGREKTARDQLLTCAKAIFAEDGYLIETLEEFCDPEIVEATSRIIERKNMKEGDESSYIHTILQLHKKIASQFLCLPREDLDQLGCIAAKYPAPPPGIRPKNKRKLKRFTPDKIREFLTLSDTLIQEVNVVLKGKRKQILAETGKKPSVERLLDTDVTRKIMLASAHDIMLARAPRSANFKAIELDWLSHPDQETTISVPAVLVKKRNRNDPDLTILLSAEKSARLWTYIRQIRPHILLQGDHENQKLFPCVHQRVKEQNRSYDNLVPGLCREIFTRLGVQINPHLYRHLIGWIWLNDDPNRLPEVQKMLGHKQLATTLASYAELDETGVLQRWNDHLAKKKTDK
jgi:integrase